MKILSQLQNLIGSKSINHPLSHRNNLNTLLCMLRNLDTIKLPKRTIQLAYFYRLIVHNQILYAHLQYLCNLT